MRVRTIRYALIWLLLVGATASVSWAAIARAGAQASLLGAPPPLAATSSTGAPAVIRPTQSKRSRCRRSPTRRRCRRSRQRRPDIRATHLDVRARHAAIDLQLARGQLAAPVQSAVKPFSTAGGQLWAYCEGGIPKARVVPAEGWGFHVSTDDARLEVTFEPPDGHGDHIEVKVRCIAGLPSFSTD